MKIFKYLKSIQVLLCLLIIAISLQCKDANAEWVKDSKGYWYKNSDSYYTGWKVINGKKYYFYPEDDYERKGYMAHDTIIDKLYLNSEGEAYNKCSNEIESYINILNDILWQKQNGIIFQDGKSTISKNILIDIDQDGIFEMILVHGTCSADTTISIVTLNNGKIEVQHIQSSGAEYYGYSRTNKTFFITGGHMGHYFTRGYKLEDKKCIECFSLNDEEEYSTDSDGYLIITGHNYSLNGKGISSKEYDEFLSKYRDIKK